MENPDPTGAAALSICEAMLLCLTDLQVLSEAEVAGLLDDAAAAHLAPGQSAEAAAKGTAAAALIATIAAGKNSVRRRSDAERLQPPPGADD